MPAVTRTLSILYGNGGSPYTVGGSTDAILDGEVKVREDLAYGRASVSFSFWVFAASDAAFITATNAAETAFTTPRQKLEIKLGSSTWRVWDPATSGSNPNSGFNQAPTIRKVGDDADTMRSRRYEVTVEIETPADLTGQAGRLDSTVNLDTEPGGRRRVTISGVYRALTTNDARAAYLAAIGTYESSVCDALIGAGLWERTTKPQEETDDAGKNLRFTRVYREILQNQALGVLDDPEIRDQTLVVTRLRTAPGDTQLGVRANRLQVVRVRYAAWVDSSSTTLLDKWETDVRPWLLQAAQDVAGLSTFAVVDEDPGLDRDNRKIDATLTILAPNGSDLLSCLVTTSDVHDPGLVAVPVWSGDVYAKHLFQGPATLVRTITTVTSRILSLGAGGAVGPVADVSAVAASQSALGLTGFGTFGAAGGLLFPARGGSAAGASASLVPSPTGPVGGSGAGFVPLGPQTTTRTARTIGLVGNELDVVDQVQVLALFYRTAP